MSNKTKATVIAAMLSVLAACPSQDQIELESPVGEPAPLPGPTLAPPMPMDTVPVGEDTLPVLQQDTI
jgi:hypothetical protein